MVNGFKVITLCGSTRFKDEFLEAQKRLTLEGNVVISVGLFGHSGDDEVWTEGVKDMLDRQHLAKIDLADEIFVVNVGGYIGESTRREIAYAEFKGKTIKYMENSKKVSIYDNYAALRELHDAGRISDEDFEKAGRDFDEKRKAAIAEYNTCKGPWPYQWKNIDAVVCGILRQQGKISIDYHDLSFLSNSYSLWEIRISDNSTNNNERIEKICQSLRSNYEYILQNAQKLVVMLNYSPNSQTNMDDMDSLQTCLNEIKPGIDIIWQMRKASKANESLEVSIIIKHKYDDWVSRVCSFLSEVGPKLGEKGTHCASFQSKPILDKQPDIVLLGYNPNEDWEYFKEDSSPERFYEGNQSFCNLSERKKKEWKIWNRLYGSFEWANYTKPLEDGNYIYFNAVYFGPKNIKKMKALPDAQKAIDRCMKFSGEVIQDIFKPKCIICLSVNECFDRLNEIYKFDNVESISTVKKTSPDLIEYALHRTDGRNWSYEYNCKLEVKKAIWNGIPIYGIPHTSLRGFNWDDFGAIALYLRSEMQKLGI
ncbi:MAG: hypothetical protein J6W43_05810 [Prevotella sp.]|nr:hypothetical protein [Prevotella sp.]